MRQNARKLRLYLIRHAPTEDSLADLYQRNDTPIVRSKVDPNYYLKLNFDKVYCSSLKRAKQTAQILFKKYEVVKGIYEYRAPKLLYGRTKEEIRVFWEKHLPDIRRDPNWKFDGSESFSEVKIRAQKFLRFLKKQPYRSIAVVGHGTFFRHLLGVNRFSNEYSFKHFEEVLRPKKWSTLEMRVIEIPKE